MFTVQSSIPKGRTQNRGDDLALPGTSKGTALRALVGLAMNNFCENVDNLLSVSFHSESVILLLSEVSNLSNCFFVAKLYI